jgi:hypothetical protein
MGRGAGPVPEAKTRRGKKSRLTLGNWAQIAKGIYKRVSKFQNLSFKQNSIEFRRILFKTYFYTTHQYKNKCKTA